LVLEASKPKFKGRIIMYINYGDKNFFEYGMLIDADHSDTEIKALCCCPYPDEEDLYIFGDCTVDITNTWIDRTAILDFIELKEENFDPIKYAIGCLNFYTWDNFGAINYMYDWQRMTKDEIKQILKHRMIASDNLNIEW
jgi:hypothetical protein